MFHPLASTKSSRCWRAAVLAITLVPRSVPVLIRGRLRLEMENPWSEV